MSASDTSGFGKFIPGFDFLQGLSKGASEMAQMPNLASWIAPTMNAEELDKRIGELKNVQFWLEQNARALAATVQALEVQKMTMATLKGMNFNLSDVAQALTPRPAAADPVAAAPQAAPPAAASATPNTAAPADQAAKPGLVDPLQLWGALTQQFQQIAATAVKEVASSQAAVAQAGAKVAAPRAGKTAAPGKASAAKKVPVKVAKAPAAAPTPVARKRAAR